MTTSLTAGATLGPYRIIAPLGAGGMGQVFRAHDPRLDREVALKILPADVVRDPERLSRFVQEARSASSLSHPNIITIYDIGAAMPLGAAASEDAPDAAQLHYISMELVRGSTLRQLFNDSSIEPRTLVAYLAQAAEGLAAAHSAGIVHRDLKPENIMVTRDGYAKVLDFGLAKLTASALSGSALACAPTALEREGTREGAVLGTIGYMSPEQAQGKPIDQRTDLFSFGCLLYEAASGRRPFGGETDIDVLHAIVRDRPTPVEELNPNIPRALARRIRRCLEKDPAQRSQSMSDMALELSDLVAEWETLARASGDSSTQSSLLGTKAPERRGLRRVGWIGILVGAPLLIAVVWSSWRSGVATTPASAPTAFQSMQIRPVTSTGDVLDLALSPDGRYLAYSRSGAAGSTLWVRQVATGSDVKIAGPQGARRELSGLVFTPDGSYVDYRVPDERGMIFDLFQVPALGGTPRKLAVDTDTPPAYSPDGRRIAFVRHAALRGTTTLITVDADGGNEQELAVRRIQDGLGYHVGLERSVENVGPVWLPESSVIAVPGFSKVGSFRQQIVLIDARDGSERPFEVPSWNVVSGIAALPDGRTLIASASANQGVGNLQLWRFSTIDGNIERLTNDLSDYARVQPTADGRSLATLHVTRTSALASVPLEGREIQQTLTPGGRDLHGTLSASADGTLVYDLRRGSSQAIWKRPADGGPPVELTRLQQPCFSPQISRDGRRILFSSRKEDGSVHLLAMNSDGSDVRELAQGIGEFSAPSFSPDGSWLAYGDTTSRRIWRQTLAAAAPTLLVESPVNTLGPLISPDGERLAYMTSRSGPTGELDTVVKVIPASGGAPLQEVMRPGFPKGRDWSWAPDGKSLLFTLAEGSGRNLWRLPLDGSSPVQLTHFESTPIFGYALVDGGKRVILAKGEIAGDAVLITDFR